MNDMFGYLIGLRMVFATFMKDGWTFENGFKVSITVNNAFSWSISITLKMDAVY